MLLLDVDGVLSPQGARPPQFTARTAGVDCLWLDPAHGRWVRELAGCFEVVWASLWEERANEVLGPVLAVGPFPHVAFDPLAVLAPEGVTGKLSAVADYAAERAVVWVDDDLGEDAVAWAASRAQPTLLLPCDPGTGWQRNHVDAALAFARSLTAG